jgi:hypothetical protein
MPEPDELNSLPETYALALRLRGEGLGDDAIARLACRCEPGGASGDPVG